MILIHLLVRGNIKAKVLGLATFFSDVVCSAHPHNALEPNYENDLSKTTRHLVRTIFDLHNQFWFVNKGFKVLEKQIW